jgi:two-component system, NarL family, nitrate/nitrite response regulator NarL
MTSRVLIVDDHPMIRSAVAMLLEGSPFEVAGSAGSAESAIEATRAHDPDMIILDLAMPGGSGLEVLRSLRAAKDHRPVIILTAGIDDHRLAEAMKLMVEGIVMKDNDPAYLLDCLQTVQGGGRWIDPEIKERAELLAKRGPKAALSHRERELVVLVAKGLRNREIAAQLGITEGTVKVYLNAIFDKLGVVNRTELAIRAAEEGLGS